MFSHDLLTVEFLSIAWVLGSILATFGAALLKQSFRVHGIASWLTLLLLSGAPTAAASILMAFVPTPELTLIPSTAAMTVIVGSWWVHVMLPIIAPDFQADSFFASAFLAVLLGASIFVVSYLMQNYVITFS